MRIIPAPSLADMTTIRLGGHAVALVRVEQDADLDLLEPTLARLGGMPFMIGRGSNLLARDGELPVTLVHVDLDATPRIIGKTPAGEVLVQAGAGCPLPRLVAWSAARGLSGLEPLSGIPGELGGALRMNAGSFGASFTDRVTEVLLFSPHAKLRAVPREQLAPGYRHTIFPDDSPDTLVLATTLALTPKDRRSCLEGIRSHIRRKAAVQPVRAMSAGCAFANPEGASAGKLLDQAGFRGKRLGGMEFSPVHANFLVNRGTGTSAEALELLHMAQERVKEQFGIALSLEVKVLP